MTDPNTLGVNVNELYRLMTEREELNREIEACTQGLPLLRLVSLLLSFTDVHAISTTVMILAGRLGRVRQIQQFLPGSPEERHMAVYQFTDALFGLPRLYVIGVATSYLGVDELRDTVKLIRQHRGAPGVVIT
jgi:hypothetical protein